jgi:hypothetical protein
VEVANALFEIFLMSIESSVNDRFRCGLLQGKTEKKIIREKNSPADE